MVRLEDKIKQLCRVNNVTQKELYSAIGITDARQAQEKCVFGKHQQKKDGRTERPILQVYSHFNNKCKGNH